jgi:hypothetical protein
MGPQSTTRISGSAPPALKEGLLGYFDGINSHDNERAWAHMGPRWHTAAYSASSFDWTTTYDFNIKVHNVSGKGSNTVAWVTFTALTAPGRGPKQEPDLTCAVWSFDYRFAKVDKLLLQNMNKKHDKSREYAFRPC